MIVHEVFPLLICLTNTDECFIIWLGKLHLAPFPSRNMKTIGCRTFIPGVAWDWSGEGADVFWKCIARGVPICRRPITCAWAPLHVTGAFAKPWFPIVQTDAHAHIGTLQSAMEYLKWVLHSHVNATGSNQGSIWSYILFPSVDNQSPTAGCDGMAILTSRLGKYLLLVGVNKWVNFHFSPFLIFSKLKLSYPLFHMGLF